MIKDLNKTILGAIPEVVTVKKNCLYISTRENKAVTRHKELYSLTTITGIESPIYFDMVDMGYSQKQFNVYIDYGFITYDLHFGFCDYNTLEDIQNRFSAIPEDQFTYEYMKSTILNNASQNKFVNVAEIKLLELGGENQNTIDMLVQARQNYIDNKNKKEEEERQVKLEKATQEYNQLMQEYDNKIVEVEKAILDKKEVKMFDVTIPEIDGYYVYRDKKNVMLELFKKYDIKVPIKTKGWINAALALIKYHNNDITYSYYTSSKNSTVFLEYLNQLVLAIQEAYGKVDNNLKSELEKNQNKENELRKIPSLKWEEIYTGSMRQMVENNKFIKQNEIAALTKDRIIELVKMSLKALKCKDIDSALESWLCFAGHISDMDNRGCYKVYYKGDTVDIYPRLVRGEVKILCLKNTKKRYMAIA